MTSPAQNIIPALEAVYVAMRDGVRLAVDVWRCADQAGDGPSPTMLLTTRYWRSFALAEDDPRLQGIFALASYFTRQGYVVVNADSRGSGASFGGRRTEWSEEEVADMGDVMEWIVRQPWSDGRVVTHGFSYGGNTAFLAAACGHPALKVIAPQFADFDIYRHNLFPGGIANGWLHDNWGRLTAAMDRGDVTAMSRLLPGIDGDSFRRLVRGPRPVDDDADGALVRQAIAGHAANFNMAAADLNFDCVDDAGRQNTGAFPDALFDSHRLSIYSHQSAIERSGVPIVYWAGWFDAGTADGALNLFASFSNPMRVIIGPWSHGRRFLQDPFVPNGKPSAIDLDENFEDVRQAVESCLAGKGIIGRRLDYYTLGENRWKSTTQWPLPQSTPTRFYLADSRQLSLAQPQHDDGSDSYVMDEAATTGTENRWHTQIGCMPVSHEDRRQADARLLTYDSMPLDQDMEITGHPIVHLYLMSNRVDVALFAYLEMIMPDGNVRLLTEGCLRAGHRKLLENDVGYRKFGPVHSFRREDIMPLAPDGMALLSFALLPISIRIPRGFRLRLAIAGADRDTFKPMPDADGAAIAIGRSRMFASYLELPVIP